MTKMKSWPTSVPLRHARFYAPKEGVIVTCCQLACKGGVFCCANDDTIFGTNTLPASWTLKLTEIWDESKIISRERPTPVCCPNYKTNSKGAFFCENPKTDLWSQIVRILHYQKNGRSEKGSFTLTTACPRATRGKKKKQQTDPHGEDKKKKQHELQLNIRNVYISVWNTNVSWIEYTP